MWLDAPRRQLGWNNDAERRAALATPRHIDAVLLRRDGWRNGRGRRGGLSKQLA